MNGAMGSPPVLRPVCLVGSASSVSIDSNGIWCYNGLIVQSYNKAETMGQQGLAALPGLQQGKVSTYEPEDA